MTRRSKIYQRGLLIILALVMAMLVVYLLILLSAGGSAPPPTDTTAEAQNQATRQAIAIQATRQVQDQATRQTIAEQATLNAHAQATGQAIENQATAGDEPPTDTPTVLPSPVAINETADAVRLGEMAVERPFAMIQGASASWLVEMYIPEQYTSLEIPTGVELIQVDSSEPPDDGALYSTDRVTLWLSRYMQVELRVPAGFILNGPPTVWKEINLDSPRPYVVWEWLLTAPDRPGRHEILLNIYQAKLAPNANGSSPVDARQRAIPPRRYKIEVVAFTPTPTPLFTPVPTPQPSTATPTPTITPTPTPVPFFDRPGTTTTVGALATIVAALIGLVGVLVAKDRIPPLTKGQKRRSLEKQISEKIRRLNLLKERQARQGITTDPAVLTEIEDLEAEIERLRQIKVDG